ncbi:MAG: hypothetical protein SFZ03_05030 [Candidatus Melainabacteria bacterium]|nr:hypothetical protein [Candidatus Melainabacteria bacterium]
MPFFAMPPRLLLPPVPPQGQMLCAASGVSVSAVSAQAAFSQPVGQCPVEQSPVAQGLALLGKQTTLSAGGVVQFNRPLVAALVAQKEAVLQPLKTYMASVPTWNRLAVAEGLFTIARLGESGVSTGRLYPVLSRFNAHPDPLVQIYLADAYQWMDNTCNVGPMLATLIHQAVRQRPDGGPNDVSEAIGHLLLTKLAQQVVAELKKSSLQPSTDSYQRQQPGFLAV